MRKRQVSIKLDEDLINKIDKFSMKFHRTRSEILRSFIFEKFDNEIKNENECSLANDPCYNNAGSID